MFVFIADAQVCCVVPASCFTVPRSQRPEITEFDEWCRSYAAARILVSSSAAQGEEAEELKAQECGPEALLGNMAGPQIWTK